jgi:copper chaperone CopZ
MEKRNTSQAEELTTLDFAIDGMTCEHCVRRVEKVLRSQPGVTQAVVSLRGARARVTFDPTKTDIPALHDAILKSGYKPSPTPL